MRQIFYITVVLLIATKGMAQMVPTRLGPWLYFNPQISKQLGLKELTITEHEKYLQHKKIKLNNWHYTQKMLFNNEGYVTQVVNYNMSKHPNTKGSDTITVPEKFNPMQIGGADSTNTRYNKATNTYVISAYGFDYIITLDSLGNTIYELQAHHPVESGAWIMTDSNKYDNQNRLIFSQTTHYDIEWNYKKVDWDTVPQRSFSSNYIYENGLLTKIHYSSWYKNGDTDPETNTVFYYQNQMLLYAESDEELSGINPTKYYMLVKQKDK